ncbi:SGNH/GDSL hydrolase family protein [Mesomycoplasma ovipneumoniae]|uniref:SGNH/GDSL hydrolase family protein n=1 Tax=Mesomycoplasma ovipneumoniae TaxID=29562 RepID=UPI003080D56D
MKKALKILFQTSTPFLLYAGIISSAVVFSAKNTNLSPNLLKKSETGLLKELKYLALGDSLSSGFDWESNLDGRGKMTDGSISGISFPAFFANFAQSIQPNSVKSFKNLALNNSSISDWIYLLDPKNNIISDENLVNLRSQTYNSSNFADTIRSVFENFSGDFSNLRNEIRNANLITISIGFKDFLNTFNSTFFDNVLSGNTSQNSYDTIATNINYAFVKIKHNLKRLITLIKNINPETYINLIGYYNEHAKIDKFLNDLLKNYLLEFEPNLLSVSRLNDEIKEVSQQMGVNFINPFFEKSWDGKSDPFFDTNLDFRPQIKANKQIAQNLIISLALSPKSLNKSIKRDENDEILLTNFSANNFDSQQLDFGSNREILEKITVNGSLENFINENSSFEEKSIKDLHTISFQQPESANYASALTQFVGFFDSEQSDIVNVFKDLINTFSNRSQPNFEAFNNVVEVILKSDFFTNLTQYAQQFIANSATQNVEQNESDDNLDQESSDLSASDQTKTSPDLLSFLKEKSLSQENILGLLKEILSSEYVQSHHTKTVNLFYNLLFNQPAISKLLVSSISTQENIQQVVKEVFQFNSVQKFVTFIFTELINNNQDYVSAKSFSQVLYLFLQNSNNYNKSVAFIKNFVIEALKRPNFLNAIFETLSTQFGFNIEKEDINSLITLITSVSDILVNTKTFKNLIDLLSNEVIFGIKSGVSNNQTDFSFFSNILSNLTNKVSDFIKDKANIYNLFQDIISFSPSAKQLDSVKSLLGKFLPFISKINLSFILDKNSENYQALNLIFESFSDFLAQDNFKELNDLISAIMDDVFLVNNYKYQNSHDLYGIIFNLLSNNSQKLKPILYKFIEQNLNNTKVLDALKSLFAKILPHEFLEKLDQTNQSNYFKKLIDSVFEVISELTIEYNTKIELTKNNGFIEQTDKKLENNLDFNHLLDKLKSKKS